MIDDPTSAMGPWNPPRGRWWWSLKRFERELNAYIRARNAAQDQWAKAGPHSAEEIDRLLQGLLQEKRA